MCDNEYSLLTPEENVEIVREQSGSTTTLTDYRTIQRISNLTAKCPHWGCSHECPSADMEAHLLKCPRKSMDMNLGERLSKIADECAKISAIENELMQAAVVDSNDRFKKTVAKSVAKLIRPKGSETGWLNYFWPKWGSNGKIESESEALDRSLAATRTAIWNLRRSVEDTTHVIEMRKRDLMESGDMKLVIKQMESMKCEIESIKEENKMMKIENKLIKNENKSINDENKLMKNENKTIKIENKLIKNENKMINDENKSIRFQILSIKNENEIIKTENKSIRNEIESIKTDIDCRRSQVLATESWQVSMEPWRGDASYDEWVTDDAIGHTEWACKESDRFSGPAPCYTYLLESANSVVEGVLWIHLLILAGPHDSLLDWPFSAAVTLSVGARDHPGVYSKQTRQCLIERPPDYRYRCRHSAPFGFQHAELRAAGLEMSHGVRISCQIVAGEDLVSAACID